MRNNRKSHKLEEVAEVFTGFPFKGDKYHSSEGTKVVRGENVTIGNLRWDTVKYWNEEFDEFEKYTLDEGDIVIGMDGSRVGKNRAQIKANDLPLLLAQRVARIRAKKNFNQDFLAHIIKSDEFENYVKAVHTGTSIPHISATQLKEFEFKATTDIKEQKEIASILSSLDNKIELNLQMNQTLEVMAQAIFKEWFVNFNFPGSTGKLVNGLPKGWSYKMLKEFGSVITGNTPSSKNPEHFGNLVPFITPSDFRAYGKIIIHSERYLSAEGKLALSTRLLPKNSVIVTCIGSDMGKVAINAVECLTNQQINSIKPHDVKTSDFLYYALIFRYEYLRNIATGGSTMPIINKTQFERIEVLSPTQNLIDLFYDVGGSFNEKIENNIRQIRILSQLRDSLLPNLMTGKIEVNA